MSTETEPRTKNPRDLIRGDEFRVPSGPHRNSEARVIAEPTATRYGNYSVRVSLLTPVDVTIDYKAELAVRESS